MKRAFQYLILALWLVTFAWSAPCKIAWNPSPGAEVYEVWQGLDKLATSETTDAVIELPTDKLSTVFVIARNGYGATLSDPFTVMPCRVQYSADLSTWHNGPLFFAPHAPSFFIRAQFIRP